ncbi:MAG: precorrin-6A reductase [Pirellulales bacterium]|nr:precorrin-6A reductase [Pirellulales bacterium]
MILLFGGTSDSRDLAVRLTRRGLSVLVSSVTQEAADRVHEVGIRSTTGRLDTPQMCELIHKRNIRQIIDASAPFADVVSRNAMSAAKLCKIPYCRYERPEVAQDASNVLRVANYADAAYAAARLGGRILLTTGVKTLPQFADILLSSAKCELFVRFIPRTSNMRLALDHGIKKQNILAMQGPFSAKFETALYDNYSIDIVVSKEGGTAGSLPSKLKAVETLGIQMVLIDRPAIEYVNRFEDMHGLIEHVIGENKGVLS